MPVDLPRRALVDEPDDVESYVARRSRGFTPADTANQVNANQVSADQVSADQVNADQVVVRPARAARALEPTATDHSSRPRRASLAELLAPYADDEKSTVTEPGIGRRAVDPLPQAVEAYAPRPEESTQVRPQPPPVASPPAPPPAAPSPYVPPPSVPRDVSPPRPIQPATRAPVPEPARVPMAAPRPKAAPAPPPIARPAPAPSPTPSPVPTSPSTLRPARLPTQTAYTPQRSPAARSEPRPTVRATQPAPATQPAERPAPPLPQPAARRTAPAPVRRTRPSRWAVDHEVAPIIVDRLVKSYNGMLAVRDLSFVVQPGCVTGFLGPNGAGKTTTMRILVGLTSPTTGTATFGGIAYAELSRPQQTVGCVLDASFHPVRSGRNHLRVLAPTAGASDRRVDELLGEVGLGEVARQPVEEYSMGMRQRLALAAAMLGNPDYLILDEPANSLDPEGIRWLRSFLRDFAASGRAVLISSHLLNEIETTADDIVVINRGRLLAQMPMSELNLGDGTTRARVSDMQAALQALASIGADVQTAVDERGAYLRIISHDVSQVGSVLFTSGIAVDELITERRDLEQEFISMLERSR
ncbi:MAG TPA: ATP-binding cassette domain-containing protein [Propionibacteriaceae bacterium]